MELHNYDSNEEWYFSWYLQELQETGYIERIKYHPKSFSLFEKIDISFIEKLKTKERKAFRQLLKPHKYQADYLIIWTLKAENLFWSKDKYYNPFGYPFILTDISGEVKSKRSIVDIKGTFNKNESWTKFSINQKWVFERYGIYIQKLIPIKLFKASFTPKRYLTTDKSGKPRKLDYKPLTLAEYVSGL